MPWQSRLAIQNGMSSAQPPPSAKLFKNFTMSASLIPIADDSIYWSSLLFDLTQPVLLTEQQYDDAYWPLISTVYTKIGGLLLQKNGTIEVQNYECRLRKSKKPGQVRPKDGVKKRYGSTVRQSGLCNVRIKTTRTVNQPFVNNEP